MDSYPAYRWINKVEYLNCRIKRNYTTDNGGFFLAKGRN